MRNSVSIGAMFLRLALAFLLIVTGIWGITGGSTLFTGITGMFSGTAQTIIVWIISIAALLAGVLLLIEIFSADFPIVDIILIVFTILWIIQLALTIINSIGTAFQSTGSILNFLHMLANQFLILAALIMCQKRFN